MRKEEVKLMNKEEIKYSEEEIKKMNKKQVDEALDKVMDRKHDLLWDLVDIQYLEFDLFERESELDKKNKKKDTKK